MRKLTRVIGLVLILAVGLGGVGRPQPERAETGDNLVLQWNEVSLQAIRDTRPFPTAAARALAMVHTAIYDAWAAYDSVAVDTRQRLRVAPALRQPSGPWSTRTRRSATPPTPPWSTCSPTSSRPSTSR
jgi:hypothetical protein